jgi:transaldolase
MTGVYTAHQALSAVAVNAEYAAPYLGRICNLSSKESGMVRGRVEHDPYKLSAREGSTAS